MSEVGPKKAKHNSNSAFGSVYHPKERRLTDRRIARERGELRLQVTEPSQQSQAFPAALVDLTSDASSFGLLTEKRLPKGTRMDLLFEGSELNGTLEVEVLWCNELPVTGNVIKVADPERRWRVGVKVTTKKDDVTEAQQRLITAIKDRL